MTFCCLYRLGLLTTQLDTTLKWVFATMVTLMQKAIIAELINVRLDGKHLNSSLRACLNFELSSSTELKFVEFLNPQQISCAGPALWYHIAIVNHFKFDLPELASKDINEFIWTYSFLYLSWHTSSALARYRSPSWAAPLRFRSTIGQITPIGTFCILALLRFLLH